MRPDLLYPGTAGVINSPLPFGSGILAGDIGLENILAAMCGSDRSLYSPCRSVLLRPLREPDALKKRQEAVTEALQHKDTLRRLYRLCLSEEESRRRIWHINPEHITGAYGSSLSYLRMYSGFLRDLRAIADLNAASFESVIWKTFFTGLQENLTDEYLKKISETNAALDVSEGMWMTAGFGRLLQTADCRLLLKEERGSFLRWAMASGIHVNTSDPTVVEDMKKRRERALAPAADVLITAASSLTEYFRSLRQELAFFMGCINLQEAMEACGLPSCTPSFSRDTYRLQEAYDLSLSLHMKQKAVANDLDGSGCTLFVITGANQGGKSTFLRSAGQIQLLAQCGMPVPAASAEVKIFSGIFTHFKKEEDETMESGKLDEELVRMSGIVSHLKPGSLVLFNESFSSTSEREGSAIARDVTDALTETGCTVFAVTHLFTYASSYLNSPGVCFLKAERTADEKRTFRIIPGTPETTAYGEDLYRQIFND